MQTDLRVNLPEYPFCQETLTKFLRFLFIVLPACTVIAPVQAQSGPSVPLVAHLPMDGEIVDSVSGVTPTVLDGTSRVEGKFGGAIHFDGNSFVQLPLDISPQAMPEMTITMWVKPDPLPDDPELAFNPLGYLLSDNDGLLMINNQQKQIPYFEAYSTGAVVHNSNHPGMRGGWQLLAVTRSIENRTTEDGELLPHTVLTLYSNGRVSEKAAIYRNEAILPYLNLGTKSKGHSYHYRGAIDDVRVYAGKMTPDEIRSAAAQQRPVPNTNATSATPGTASDAGESFEYGGPLQVGINATSVTPVVDDGEGSGDPQPYTPFASPSIDAPDLTDGVDPKLVFSGDWAIRSIDRIDANDLYPGSKFDIAVDIEKNDPDENFPTVQLRVGSEFPRQVASTGKVVVSLQVPILTTEKNIQLVAVLRSSSGGSLDDYHPSNNRMQISIPVNQNVVDDGQPAAEDAQVTGNAETTTPYTYPDIALHSGISGSEGENVATLYNHARQDVVTLVEILEKSVSNKPCYIVVRGSDFEIGRESLCEIFSPPAPIGVARDPITALQVCHSTFNSRIKGLRVWRQSLKSDGSYDGYRPYELNNAEEPVNRANCSRWREKVSCSRDAVATGIRAHYTDSDEIVGLQLMCTEVIPN